MENIITFCVFYLISFFGIITFYLINEHYVFGFRFKDAFLYHVRSALIAAGIITVCLFLLRIFESLLCC